MAKVVTIQDVAVALGMNKSTISNALSGNGNVSLRTRERIASVAREMGYEPNPLAQRLAKGHRNDTICLFSGVLDRGLAMEKVLLIQQALAEWEQEPPIYATGRSNRDPARAQAAQIRQVCRQKPRAIICATHSVDPIVYEELERYQQAGGLVVSYDAPIPLPCDQVIFDREDNAYRAARYLLEQGHRRIGVAMSRSLWHPSLAVGDPQWQRQHGFQRALGEFGLTLPPAWQFRHAVYERGGEELARQFLAMPPRERPTALCIVNDYVALAFLAEVLQAGVRVPEELSVIGHDNEPVAAYCPIPLTSMTHPAERIATTVAEMLMDRVRNGAEAIPPRQITLKSELIQRRSVAPPSHG